MSLEAETKKWFPASNSSRDVREKLLLSCSDAGATFKFHCSVSGVQVTFRALARGMFEPEGVDLSDSV